MGKHFIFMIHYGTHALGNRIGFANSKWKGAALKKKKN